jgi:hypothetical protein
MYTSAGGGAASAAKEQGKLAQPEMKWELKNVHDKKGGLPRLFWKWKWRSYIGLFLRRCAFSSSIDGYLI